ncbi:putative flagellar biosynthetic protein fliR [Gluconacetobacter johannae DSM 13595]|uniref:Flagellar biosynthetic protein FliR n=1 Tax=Gluconacetobacter johannae TaxID=112140 RepID=A0A7W4P4K0_9PROT|nr:flagellar biosynthetic protein FliR [Gluconacetobacter johannae]MBB2177311.1 flagellar biosynthetic protein FliR [Gluconacetobacter johannae]GBQ82622.1 putative flagellar biosynthetic protein fliR [Gluconacetobacter johannae DSM 13595]
MTGHPSVLDGSVAVLAAMFLVVLCRVSALVMTAPGLGETTSPMVVRAGIALSTTFVILPVVQDHLAEVSGDALHMPSLAVAIVAGELLCGAFIGWLARLIALALNIAMQIIAVFTGLSSVLQPDAELGASNTAISNMASSLIPVIFLSTGLYVLPLAAITGSYSLFPPGHMPMVGDMARSVTEATSQAFVLAMQLAAPFVLVGTLWPAMLGVLNRLLPAIQVYSIAMPAQLLGGVLLLAMLIQVMTGVWQERAGDLLVGLPGIGAGTPHH